MIRWIVALLTGRRRPTAEAAAARESAAASMVQAHRDLAEAERQRDEADVIAERLRAHNAANRYDDWLREVLSR